MSQTLVHSLVLLATQVATVTVTDKMEASLRVAEQVVAARAAIGFAGSVPWSAISVLAHAPLRAVLGWITVGTEGYLTVVDAAGTYVVAPPGAGRAR